MVGVAHEQARASPELGWEVGNTGPASKNQRAEREVGEQLHSRASERTGQGSKMAMSIEPFYCEFSETEVGWEIQSTAMSWGKNPSSQESQFRGGEAAVFPTGLGGDSLPFLDP